MWPRNWKKQFPACVGGIMKELQQQLGYFIRAFFTMTAHPVLCRSASPTGSQVPVFDWRNKFCAKLILIQINYMQLTVRLLLLPPDPSPPLPPVILMIQVAQGTCTREMDTTHMIRRRTDHGWRQPTGIPRTCMEDVAPISAYKSGNYAYKAGISQKLGVQK